MCGSHIRIIVFTLLLCCSGIIFYHQLLDGALRDRQAERQTVNKDSTRLDNMWQTSHWNPACRAESGRYLGLNIQKCALHFWNHIKKWSTLLFFTKPRVQSTKESTVSTGPEAWWTINHSGYYTKTTSALRSLHPTKLWRNKKIQRL